MLIKEYIINLEENWNKVLSSLLIDNAELLRYGEWHRVYKKDDQVYKIELLDNLDNKITLNEEYKILKKVYPNDRNIKLIKNKYVICLKLKYIDGNSLDNLLLSKSHISNFSIVKFAIGLFKLSMKGIKYNQLRGRHIFLNINKKIEFIDFGYSDTDSKFNALIFNFSPVKIKKNNIMMNNFYSLCIMILKKKILNRYKNPFSKDLILSTTYNRYILNKKRLKKYLPDQLFKTLGDKIVSEELKNMETYVKQFFEEKNHNIIFNSYEIKLLNYGFGGLKDWNLIFNKLVGYIKFNNSTIIDYGCGISPIGAFSRVFGSKICVSVDESENLINAAKSFSRAFGYNDNKYVLVKNLKNYNLMTNAKESILIILNPKLEDHFISEINYFDKVVFMINKKFKNELFNRSKSKKISSILNLNFNREIFLLDNT